MDNTRSGKLPLFCTVGEFIGEFQRLEDDLVRWITLLQNLQTDGARNKKTEQDIRTLHKAFKDKCDALEEIIEPHVIGNPEEKSKLQKLLDRIDTMRRKRNIVVHASQKIETATVVNNGEIVSEAEIMEMRNEIRSIWEEFEALIRGVIKPPTNDSP